MPLDVISLVQSEIRGTSGVCRTCAFLETRPDDELEGWRSVLADKALYGHTAVARAMAKAAPDMAKKPSKDSVAGHRENGHQ